MPAPLAKGLIIAASVLVAAGIAIYESPQVRQWVDQSRRKIAVALHSLGDEIQPRRDSTSDSQSSRRREEQLRRRRNELIRKARAEGVAVDLDELSRIGREDEAGETSQRTKQPHRRPSARSFDDLVGEDGKLKPEETIAQSTTALDSSDAGLRRRRQGVAGFGAGSAAANPFADDEAQILFDRELAGADDDDEAPSPHPFVYSESRESSVTAHGEPTDLKDTQLIDLTPEPVQPELPQTASIKSLNSIAQDEQFQADASDHATQSFYSLPSVHSDELHQNEYEDSELDHLSTGTLTPRSEGLSTAASVVGSYADDIAVLSMQNDSDHDARSDAFSEGGFSEFEEGNRRAGIMTPNSWTDVGSDDESDFGASGVQGTQNWGQSTLQQH